MAQSGPRYTGLNPHPRPAARTRAADPHARRGLVLRSRSPVERKPSTPALTFFVACGRALSPGAVLLRSSESRPAPTVSTRRLARFQSLPSSRCEAGVGERQRRLEGGPSLGRANDPGPARWQKPC